MSIRFNMNNRIEEIDKRIRELERDIERYMKETRELINETPLLFVKIELVKVALDILNYNNNRDDILCSKNDIVKIGTLSMTKNEFKKKYSKMYEERIYAPAPSYDVLINLVKDSIITIGITDFSLIHRESIIIFAKEIIENYEDVMNYV